MPLENQCFVHQMENGWTQNPRAPCVFVSYLPLSQYSVFSKKRSLGSTRKPNHNSLPTSFRWCLDLAPEVRHHPLQPHQHLAPDQQGQIFGIKKRDRMQTRLFSYAWLMLIFLSKKQRTPWCPVCQRKRAAPLSLGSSRHFATKVWEWGRAGGGPVHVSSILKKTTLCNVEMGSQHLNPSCPVCRVESDWKRRNLETRWKYQKKYCET